MELRQVSPRSAWRSSLADHYRSASRPQVPVPTTLRERRSHVNQLQIDVNAGLRRKGLVNHRLDGIGLIATAPDPYRDRTLILRIRDITDIVVIDEEGAEERRHLMLHLITGTHPALGRL